MTRKIITENVFPPIPCRDFDWLAQYDGDEPNDNGSMAQGYGRTEAQAVADLIENHPLCKDKGGHVGARGECTLCDAEAGEACRP